MDSVSIYSARSTDDGHHEQSPICPKPLRTLNGNLGHTHVSFVHQSACLLPISQPHKPGISHVHTTMNMMDVCACNQHDQ